MTTPGAVFQQLHRSGTFLLVNVHDPGTAVVAEAAGAVALDDGREVGVRRVSVGGSLYRATIAAMRRYVEQMLSAGSFSASPPPLSDGELGALVPDRSGDE